MRPGGQGGTPLSSQSGMTLVELLVGMAVMGIVLTALVGVLFNVSGRYQQWVDRVHGASTSGAAMATSIQADSHRYVVCRLPRRTDQVLQFCLPGTSTPAVATYTITSVGGGYAITRSSSQDPNGRLLARDDPGNGRPWFWADCVVASGTISGHIHVYNFRPTQSDSAETFSVYYRAPMPASGSCP